MSTNQIEELKKQFEVIQQKIAEIEKEEIIKEQDNCLIKSITKEGADALYLALADEDCHFKVGYRFTEAGTKVHPMQFADEEQCKRYAEALTTFILLRKQPGSEVASNVVQFVIDTDSDGSVTIRSYNCYWFKIGNISPCFNSVESARKAFETLGEERILNMFKYFHS